MDTPEQPSDEQMVVLREFAHRHGSNWKYQLELVWLYGTGLPDGPILRQLRNQFGPRWLVNFKEF